jgi:hypothetical protein
MVNGYEEMTVNERLYVSGLMDKFDRAVAQKDVDAVVSILREIDLSDSSIEPILQKLGLR